MRVLMMPDLRGVNPYQRLLADSLRELGADIRFARGYKRGLPFWRAWNNPPRAEVLHLHWLNPYLRGKGLLTQAAYCLRLLADVSILQACGTKVVWTVHNRVSHESAWPKLEKWLQGRLVKKADRIIVHARASLEELQGDIEVPVQKTSIIPHGHYRSAYGPPIDQAEARRAMGLPETGRIYLFFGMLRPYKGIERLVEDWRKTVSLHNEDHLVIAGTPCDEEFLGRVAALASGCSSIEIRAGFVPPEKIAALFSAADLVVLPFSSILTSGSLLLAMSYGKPIIAPRFGAIVEAVGDADDLLYDPEDKGALHVSLERSAGMPLRSLQTRTERMCEGLDWGTVAGLTLKAYQAATHAAN